MANWRNKIANFHTDEIIALGLILALLLKISGDIAITIVTGTSPPADLPMNIISSLAGYMGRTLIEKSRPQHDEEKENHRNDSNTEHH